VSYFTHARSARLYGLTDSKAGEDAAVRIVQISDTHLSQDKPRYLDNWAPLAAWTATQHPDLVIHTGDVTGDGAGVEVDLS
jgi:predicted MPP superfamily phosphohydrolase